MFSLKAFLLAAPLLLTSLVSASPVTDLVARGKDCKECGKYEILFTGLPPYHPTVIAQGYDPAQVDAGLKAQLVELVQSGYNTKELFWGPEQGIVPLEKALKERNYDGVVVGFGIRGDPSLNATIHFEQIVNLLRVKAPKAVQMFNYSPTSTVEAVQRSFPLGDCSEMPGKNYGEEIICSVCSK